MRDQRLAGIDIGTLTCRLLIADLPPIGLLKELHSERRILRLGEGVDQLRRLKREAMDRVLRCLSEWRTVIAGHHVDAYTVVATSAEWLLFDTHDAQKGGGTGRTFDWSLLARVPRSKPFFLAGGITPDNVADAIRAVRPDAIDVASGVESAPGVKDQGKLRKLFDRVRET